MDGLKKSVFSRFISSMISKLVDVQSVSSRTMLVTDRADESFSQQVSGLDMDPD